MSPPFRISLQLKLRSGLLTLFVPQAQVATHEAWDKNQERLLGAFVGFNAIALLLIFLLVPETAGASVSKEHGKLNYMSLEELNYIFGVPTAKHIEYQIRHVLPWALEMVKYASGRVRRRRGKDERPYIEKMYYWVAVKQSEENVEGSGGEEGTGSGSEKGKEPAQEHREVVAEVKEERQEPEHREVVDGTSEESTFSRIDGPWYDTL